MGCWGGWRRWTSESPPRPRPRGAGRDAEAQGAVAATTTSDSPSAAVAYVRLGRSNECAPDVTRLARFRNLEHETGPEPATPGFSISGSCS